MEFFIISDGELWRLVYDILIEKAAAGVEIRLMYDEIGSMWKLPKQDLTALQEANIKIHVFNPIKLLILPSFLFNWRDHRKMIVIDGDVCYTGGSNLADEYVNIIERFGHWKDAGLRLHGSATWSFTVMFLTLWNYLDQQLTSSIEEYYSYRPRLDATTKNEQHGILIPYDDVPDDGVEIAANVYRNIINRANHSIYIMTPYLVMDETMNQALYTAAESGVDVKIITPHHPDKPYVHAVTRSYYKQLIQHGIEIYEYKPGFIHSKVILVDGIAAVVGTVNFDYRSLYLHLECAVWMYDTECITAIKRDFEDTLPICLPITKTICEQWSIWKRAGQWFLRLFAPLM